MSAGFTVGRGRTAEIDVAAHRSRYERRVEPGIERERERERDIERASTTWSTSSFTSYHGQLLSLAVQWGVAIEIERAIKKNASF